MRPSVPTIAVDLRALVGVPTGIGVYTREILLELAKTRRFRILGMSHHSIAAEEAERLGDAGVVLDVEPVPLGVLWQQLRFAPRAQALGADLVWSPLQTLPWVTGLPAVVTVHDLTVILKPETHRQRVVWSQRPFLRRSFAAARAIVTVSRATARDVRRFAPDSESRIVPIASGVDAKFRPDAEARARVRAELELPHGYLLYAGTLEPRKNLGILFRAWEALRSEITDPGGEGLPPLLVVGPTGWKTDAILSEIQRLSPQGLRALGRVSEERLIELMQGASVFAYPSLYEGFGLPPLEALACGVPTVVSDVSSLPEVVGNVGLRVPPQDLDAWKSALNRAWKLRDDARMRSRAVSWARQFTWQKSADRHAAVFERLLAGQSTLVRRTTN